MATLLGNISPHIFEQVGIFPAGKESVELGIESHRRLHGFVSEKTPQGLVVTRVMAEVKISGDMAIKVRVDADADGSLNGSDKLPREGGLVLVLTRMGSRKQPPTVFSAD